VRNGINRGDPSGPPPDGENAVYAGSDLDLDFLRATEQGYARSRTTHSEGPRSVLLPKIKTIKFSFDSTFVTFFEHVLTFYPRISGHIRS
jgi:hypothetical protein